jgi:hypothetical protein
MRSRVAVAVAALLLAAPAAGGEPCQGRLTGSVTGTFSCEVSLLDPGDGEATFVVRPTAPIPDVPSYAPGAFRVPLPVAARTFVLDDLGMGKASVAAEGGVLYTATKTTGQRGEVTLTLRTVERDPRVAGAWIVHGTYRARLVPAGSGKQGEVIVEVTF